MTDAERVRKEAFIRTSKYKLDNDVDFPAGSIQAIQIAAIDAELAILNTQAVDQAVGEGAAGSAFESKDTARENLRAEMAPIAALARVMEHSFDGISEIFRMPRNRSDQDTLTTARAWFIASAPYEPNFIAYGMPSHFRDNLNIAADNFENSFPATVTATDERVAATAELGASIRRGMIALRTVKAIMKVKYANNVGKLAAWLSATHIEKS